MSVSTLPRIFGGVGVSDDLTFRPSSGMSESSTAATLSLNFITEAILMAYQRKNLTDIVTFTRASTKTYFGSDGLLKTAAINEWPLEYDSATLAPLGRSVWESRTNLLAYSEHFSNAAWTRTRATVTPNAVVAPDGMLTADKLVEDTTASASHFLIASVSGGVAQTVTGSVFVKSGERGWAIVQVRNSDTSADAFAWINLSTGAVGNTSGSPTVTVTNAGNGWYRVALAKALTATGTYQFAVYASTANGSVTHTGDGISGIYIWGAQLEAGAFATPYIPTAPTFTSRASTATYFNSSGVLTTAAINEARNGYGLVGSTWVSQGLILEAAATNLLVRSEEFDNASWVKSNATVSANAVVAPDGGLTADKLVEDTAMAGHRVRQNAATSAIIYTYSVFVKAAERTFAQVRWENNGGTQLWAVNVNLTNGASSSTSFGSPSSTSFSVTNVGGGWYRVSLSVLADGLTNRFDVYTSTALGTVNYTGDGISGIYIWGAQLETGSVATSYIKTEAATVTRAADVSSSVATTRAADVAVMTGTNFSDWYNQVEGCFVVEASIPTTITSANKYTYAASNGTTAERIVSVVVPTSPPRLVVVDGGVTQVDLLSVVPIANNAVFRTAETYKLNDFAVSRNGGAVSADNTATVPTPDRLNIGSNQIGSEQLNGYIRSIVYYPKRLSNDQLVALSS